MAKYGKDFDFYSQTRINRFTTVYFGWRISSGDEVIAIKTLNNEPTLILRESFDEIVRVVAIHWQKKDDLQRTYRRSQVARAVDQAWERNHA